MSLLKWINGTGHSENSYSGPPIHSTVDTEILDALNIERGGYIGRVL